MKKKKKSENQKQQQQQQQLLLLYHYFTIHRISPRRTASLSPVGITFWYTKPIWVRDPTARLIPFEIYRVFPLAVNKNLKVFPFPAPAHCHIPNRPRIKTNYNFFFFLRKLRSRRLLVELKTTLPFLESDLTRIAKTATFTWL